MSADEPLGAPGEPGEGTYTPDEIAAMVTDKAAQRIAADLAAPEDDDPIGALAAEWESGLPGALMTHETAARLLRDALAAAAPGEPGTGDPDVRLAHYIVAVDRLTAELAAARAEAAGLRERLARIERTAKSEAASMDAWWAASGDDWAVPNWLPGKFLLTVLAASPEVSP